MKKEMKKEKSKKLTKEQKGILRVVLAANKYFELSRKQSEKESEDWFFKQIENIINEKKPEWEKEI